MAVRRLHPVQPASFAFTPANEAWVKRELTKYPPGRERSAVIPVLWRAQEQEGWVTEPAIRVIGQLLHMPAIQEVNEWWPGTGHDTRFTRYMFRRILFPFSCGALPIDHKADLD